MNRSIGIFDSGFGGLTVMKAIIDLLPHEDIIYFGDTARLPYGTKSKETILRYSLENAEFLLDQGIKVLVVACHTACSFALEELQQKLKIPVIGVTIPAIEHVAQSSSGQIAVLATRGTVNSGMYQQTLQKSLPSADITSIQCQLLVQLVEEGYIDHPITHATIQEYLQPLQNKAIDTLILGCTHFPLLLQQIQKAVGSHVSIIDPAKFCAQTVKKVLEEKKLLNPQMTAPHYQFFVSDDPEKFRSLGKAFLGHPLEEITAVK
jgi:glutamate racemase